MKTMVKDKKNGEKTKENNQVKKINQLAYMRKLQYQMQNKDLQKKILEIAKEKDRNIQIRLLEEIITPFKKSSFYSDLKDNHKIFDLLDQFKEAIHKNETEDINRLVELDTADDLKRGITANMIGVVSYLLKKYNYNVYISIENLSRSWANAIDGLNGRVLPKNLKDNKDENDVDYKKIANQKLAGLGTYHYFEMQLLRKLFKIQKENKVMSLVPLFRSVEDYEDIRKLTKKEKNVYVCKRFGTVDFVDPAFTSLKCPCCGGNGKKNVIRNHDKDTIKCKGLKECKNCKRKCKYFTSSDNKNLPNNLCFIKGGDDNGAYHIALKTLENLNKRRYK